MQYKIRGTKVVSPYPVKLTPAEARLVFMLQKYFVPERIFADYFLPKDDKDGSLSEKVMVETDLLQIDCLAVDRRGIFVFESKDYAGWIYGHGDRAHWTQVLAYGKNKNQFYNPIRQNQAHARAIRALCGDYPIYSVIVFGREATLKVLEDMPKDCIICTQAGLYNALDSLSNGEILTEDEVEEACQKLVRGRVSPSTRVRAEHVAEIENIVEFCEEKYD